MLALVTLADGPVRFGGLRRRLQGVSQKMLSQTLRHLERDGIVLRVVRTERPLRVDYLLTDRGRTLLPLALALKTWAEQNLKDIERSNAKYDRRAAVSERTTGLS
jgi:DNA-binding HxlR family transcriptional regulator